MILKNSILSAFNERGTLLKWLKKVEQAIQASVLNSVDLIQSTKNKLKVQMTFANGETVESNEITIEGSGGGGGGGSTKEITSIDTLSNGKATDVNYGDGKAIIEGKGTISYDDGTSDSPNVRVTIPIVGSDTIIVDENDTQDAIELHLDAEVTQKIESALTLPTVTPTEQSLVAITPGNAQTMLKIGTGLTISNGKLNATGGGSGGLQFPSEPPEIPALVAITDTNEQMIAHTFRGLLLNEYGLMFYPNYHTYKTDTITFKSNYIPDGITVPAYFIIPLYNSVNTPSQLSYNDFISVLSTDFEVMGTHILFYTSITDPTTLTVNGFYFMNDRVELYSTLISRDTNEVEGITLVIPDDTTFELVS